MSKSEFVHLHNHTEYSLLDGACRLVDDKGKPAELFNLIAKEYKMPALAITDHGNMYGALEFYWAARDSGIKPIIGCEVYVAPKSRFDKTPQLQTIHGKQYYHLTLLARDFEGYQNLMNLVSLGFTEGFYSKPRVDKEILQKYSKGIIALSGCLSGEVAASLLVDNFEYALKAAEFQKEIFGRENYYIEIMDNGILNQQKILPKFLELAKKIDVALVATNDCHFLKKEDAKYHDILLCIGTGKSVNDTKRMRFESDLFFYRSPEEMIATFSFAPQSIKSTLEIAEKVNLEIPQDVLHLPKFPVPKEYNSDSQYLEKLCNEGLKKRYLNITREHIDRLNMELSVINRMNFASYFLIVSDFIQYAKSKKIPVGPGRGSGAGSIVTYALGITDICPLKYGLLFERFLNPDRISMPDLDIDFADSGRDEVIQYVREKYGEEKCAQIITFGSMKARNAIKDVARTMDFAVVESNNIAKLIDQNLTISEALIQSKELKTLVEKSERIAELIKAAKKLEGLKRHTGVHAAGMIIADEEIIKYSPLAKGRDDIITTQYDGVVLPELGLLKVDFLGLRTLTIIDECVADIKIKNPDFNMDDIPLDDKKTYELLESAKTFGVFQLESKGIRDLISRLKPSVIDDVIALVALYRPGPMGSGMLDDFVNRKHGRTPIVYDHPLQETILKDSYGVILYQEQAMKMAVSLAGFTPGQSDKLRKAMSKKNTEVFKEQREKFTKGAEEKGITLRVANRIFDNIERFAGYGFNKSHSAAYGVLSYRTAYLKANFPLEYMTALLNSEVGRSNTKDGEESRIKTYLDDLESFGIKILPPDIQSSDGKFKIEGENIRFGLLAVKGVGQTFAESIEDSRKDEIFKNWDNFLERIDLKSTNKTGFENLAKAGAFDCFDSDKFSIRANIVRNIESYIDKASKIKKDKETSQGFLFDTKATFTATILSKNAKPLELFEALNYEKEVLGFYLSGHPLSAREKEIMAYSNYSLDKLPAPKPGVDYKSAKSVRIAGMIVFVKKLTSKKDKKPYAKFKLEDLSGSVDVVMFNKKFEEFERYLAPNNIIVVKGLLMGTSEALEIVVDQIWTVDEAKKTFEPKDLEVCIKLSTARYDDDLNKKLVTFFSSYKGKSKLSFHLEDSSHGNFAVETPYLINCCDDFVAGVEKIIGYKNCINFRYCG